MGNRKEKGEEVMLCPMKFSGNFGPPVSLKKFECEKEECAWWVGQKEDYEGHCAIKGIRMALSWIGEKI